MPQEGRKENGAILSINLVFVRFTLPKTNIAPENGWLEYDRFLLGWPTFRGELLVSGSVSKIFLEGLLTVRCHRVYYSQWYGNFGGCLHCKRSIELLHFQTLEFMPLTSQQMAISLNKGVEGAQTPIHARYNT